MTSELFTGPMFGKTPAQKSEFDYSVVDQAVELIVNAVSPHLIIIFGSVARKAAKKGSDIDILVVMDSDKPIEERYEVNLALRDLPVPWDVFVLTPEEFVEKKDDEYNFIYEIVRTGFIAYEDSNRRIQEEGIHRPLPDPA